jgi:hypothetical protein
MRIAKIASLLAVAGTVGLFGLSAPAARANINTTASPTVTPLGGGLFEYDYPVGVDAVQRVVTGDFFTIYDFPGFVSATAPVDWAVSSALVGVTPGNQNPIDNPALPNVTFTYTGLPTLPPGSDLGHFVVTSTVGGGPLVFSQDNFSGRGTNAGNNLKKGNTESIEVPTAAVPEPISMALLLPGLLPLGLAKMRRKNRS